MRAGGEIPHGKEAMPVNGKTIRILICVLCLLLGCAGQALGEKTGKMEEMESPPVDGTQVETADATGNVLTGADVVLEGRTGGVRTLCVFSGAEGHILVSTAGKTGYSYVYTGDGARVTSWKITSGTGSLCALARIGHTHHAVVRVQARKTSWDADRPDEEQLLWINAYNPTAPAIFPAFTERREIGHGERIVSFDTGIPAALVELWREDEGPVTTAVADETGRVVFDRLHAADGLDHFATTLCTFGNYDVHAATAYAADPVNLLPAAGGTGVEWATSNDCATYVSRVLTAGGLPIYAPYANSSSNPGGSVRHVLESFMGAEAFRTEFTIDDFHEGDLVWGHDTGHVMYCAGVNRAEGTIHVYGHSASAGSSLSDDGWISITLVDALMQLVQEIPVPWTYRIGGVEDPRPVVLMDEAGCGQEVRIVREGAVLILPESPFAPPAHHFFAGWLVEGAVLQPGEEVTVAGPMTITVQWKDTLLRGEADLVLPAGISRIEPDAFEQTAAESVFVPDSCTSIGEGAFRNCPHLQRIRIPADCEIGAAAFEGCGELVIFGTPGSAAEAYCQQTEGFRFVPET